MALNICDHDVRWIASAEEGTQHCMLCEVIGEFDMHQHRLASIRYRSKIEMEMRGAFSCELIQLYDVEGNNVSILYSMDGVLKPGNDIISVVATTMRGAAEPRQMAGFISFERAVEIIWEQFANWSSSRERMQDVEAKHPRLGDTERK